MPAKPARWWAVASGEAKRPLFWSEPGVWVSFPRDARRFRTPAEAEAAAAELGRGARAVEVGGRHAD